MSLTLRKRRRLTLTEEDEAGEGELDQDLKSMLPDDMKLPEDTTGEDTRACMHNMIYACNI